MAPEEQTSACLLCASVPLCLCASVPLWFNLLTGTSSKKVYHRGTETQRRRTERRGGRGIEANLPTVPHSRVSPTGTE